MASISCRGIYKIYSGNVQAVTDFNLEIEDKEFIILVGPSGCGKSTKMCIRDRPMTMPITYKSIITSAP